MEDLIEAVNDAIKIEHGIDYGNVKLSYNARIEKVTVHLKDKDKFALVGRMPQLHGFAEEKNLQKQPKAHTLLTCSTWYIGIFIL